MNKRKQRMPRGIEFINILAEGQDARLAGLGSNACPWLSGSTKANAWKLGWRSANDWINVGQWLDKQP